MDPKRNQKERYVMNLVGINRTKKIYGFPKNNWPLSLFPILLWAQSIYVGNFVLEVPRSSFKKRLWLSARRKKKGPRPRRNRVGKENICPDNNRYVILIMYNFHNVPIFIGIDVVNFLYKKILITFMHKYNTSVGKLLLYDKVYDRPIIQTLRTRLLIQKSIISSK